LKADYLSVVIPAFNEQQRIVATIEELTGYLGSQDYEWEIIVANDGSTDSTADLIQDYAAHNPRVRLLSLPHGGKGWAVQQGMLKAEGTLRFLCDADLSMPVECLPKFLPPIRNGFDIVIGSREVAGAVRYQEPRRRHIMGRIFNWLVRLLAVPGIYDTQCGFKLFTQESAQILFTMQKLKGFGFDVEILFLARKMGMHIFEIPIPWYFNNDSKVRPLLDSFNMARDLLTIRWRHTIGGYDLRHKINP
jgi:dolichyl-phosphate beta-glucosyltransferase